MHPAWRPTRRDWIDAIVLGAIAGTIILGVGGRVGMRYVGLAMGQPAGFSWGGTMTVVFMGLVSGVVGALTLVGARSIRPLPQWARGSLYWAVLLYLTARGLHPIDATKVIWLLPPVLAYGVILQYGTCRVATRRRQEFAPAA
jgi:hypothetical protein